ncbi:MAG: Mur ligase family protein [Chlamydiales bacterium]
MSEKVLILGMGVSGKAAAAFLSKQGVPFVIKERAELPNEEFAYVVKSPGIPITDPAVQAAKARGLLVIGEVDLGLRALKNKKLLGITGSNGKTTTTLLVAHVLSERAVAVGNIGLPLVSQVESKKEVFVIELSSFQLETLQPAPYFDAAVLLNLTPNHLDRHASMEEYAAAKFRIASCMKKGAEFWIQKKAAAWGKIEQPLFFDEIKLDLPLAPHDLDNAKAAYVLCRKIGVSDAEFMQRVQTFQKPPHRMELVKIIGGVTYINDSKATSVDAVIKAVEAVNTPILLIAGGVDKGGSFESWITPFMGKVAHIFAIGGAAHRIAAEIHPKIPVTIISSLQESVLRAKQMAKRGDTVLLSCGCSSFDQFKSFEHRGECFREYIVGEKKL